MTILESLSSRLGDRTEQANRNVARRCVDDPSLLAEIVQGLGSTDIALAGDCTEVLTLIAETRPERVAPYAGALLPLLQHRVTRVRWEAMHALALSAGCNPAAAAAALPTASQAMRADGSVIVRDYAVDAIGAFGTTGALAAAQAHALLIEALDVWHGRHAGHALAGLARIASLLPAEREALRAVAGRYAATGRPVERKAAASLAKALRSTAVG